MDQQIPYDELLRRVNALESELKKGRAGDSGVGAFSPSINHFGTTESFEGEIERRKRIEKELRESEERYRAMVEDQSELIARHQPDYKLQFVNDALARYFSTTREELIGKSFIPLLHEADRNRVMAFYVSLTRKTPLGTDEHRVILPDGEVRWHQWNARALFDTEGNLIGYQSVGRDITERKQMEDALRESEERYRIVTKHTADGIVVVQQGRFVFVNDAFAYMCGYEDAVKLVGTVAADIIDPVYRTDYIRLIDSLCFTGTKESVFRARILRSDGRELWGEGLHTVIQWGGRPAVLGTVRDITESKHRETESKRECNELREQNIKLAATIKDRYRLGKIVGKSHVMQQVYEQILAASASNANVVVYGESGTGKELVAHAIHELSDRSTSPFVPVNCGAIPEQLMESQFFGHKKGTFTGSDTDKNGFLDFAHKGTLFLDEVGNISLGIQAKLLRAIEGGGHTPLGSNQVRTSDFRIIAATNRPLLELVQKRVMREDFFFRIHILPIYLPPLRERKEDMILLIDHFMRPLQRDRENRSLPGKILDALVDYDWPGNVRELQNVLQRYVTVGRLDFASEWRSGMTGMEIAPPSNAVQGEHLPAMVERFEKQAILKCLKRHGWNRSRAAVMLGIPRRTLYDKLRKYGMLMPM
jgi:PAS domain S-box-containing protein